MKISLVNNQTPETLSVAAKFKEMCLKEEIEIVADCPDLVVSIGGDGTLLAAFHKYQEQLHHVRFVGIHTGHLGFYTDWQTHELPELIESLKQDKGESVSYPLLDLRVKYADEEEEVRYIALNEASLKKMDGTMVCDIYVKEDLFETFRGDGICVSTPTGSTGFSKSLGGAVIHPRTEVIQLTEMASVNNRVYRTLSSPMIIAKDEWIVVYPEQSDKLILSVDHLTFKERSIEKVVYRVASERVHFARYRHTHFWNRVEDAFIGMKNQGKYNREDRKW